MGPCKCYAKHFESYHVLCSAYVHRFFICNGWREFKGKMQVPLHKVFQKVYHPQIPFEDIIEQNTYLSKNEKLYLLKRRGNIDIKKLDISLSFKIISLLTKEELSTFTKFVVKTRNYICHLKLKQIEKDLAEKYCEGKINELKKKIKENGCVKKILERHRKIHRRWFRRSKMLQGRCWRQSPTSK